MTSTLTRAVLRAYDAAVHKADVQLVTSLPTFLTALPVATGIPPDECVAGRECAVLLFDDNPDNAVVVTVHGAVPAFRTSIQDADGDTYVRAEESADEDKVRFAAGGTLRYLIQAASPHHQFTGDVQVTGGLGIQIAPSLSTPVQVYMDPATNPSATTVLGLQPTSGWPGSAAATIQVLNVAGSLAGTNVGAVWRGLNFAPSMNPGTYNRLSQVDTRAAFGTAVTLTDHEHFRASRPLVASARAWTNLSAYYIDSLLASGSGAVTNLWGLRQVALAVAAGVTLTNRWGTEIADQTERIQATSYAYGHLVNEFNTAGGLGQWPYAYGTHPVARPIWGIDQYGLEYLAAFTVAALPAAGVAGRFAFATNGRKVGEGAGAGTGTTVYDDGTAWRRTGDDTVVAA